MKSPNIFLVLLTSQPGQFVSLGWTGWCYNRGRQQLNHIDKLPVQRNSLHSVCFMLVYSVTSRRDGRELVCDWMGGQVRMSWAEYQRVSFAKGSGTENLECCCLESGMGLRFWAFLVKTQLMQAAPWPGCGGAFFLFILPEKAPPISTHASPPHIPAFGSAGIFSRIIHLSSSSLGWMQESRVSAVPPPGQWSGSAEPWGLVVLPDFIPEESVCVCVKIDFSFWGSFRVRANLRSKYKISGIPSYPRPWTTFLTISIHTRVIHLLNQWTCIDASLSLRLH